MTEADLNDLMTLMRAYCAFYRVTPDEGDLLTVSRSLIAHPDLEGLQILARSDDGTAVGFATLYWSWSTLAASRIAVMNDLFVAPEARGSGLAEALIEECRARARWHGATSLRWQTAKDNRRAQAVYDRLGAQREEWLDYWLSA